MNWKVGPLPTGTFNWGGVVLRGEENKGVFRFADFCGDFVRVDGVLYEPDDVVLYNNSLTIPPKVDFSIAEESILQSV